MTNIQKRLGTRIREIRKERRQTIAQLAEAVNLSDNFIGSIERGVRSPAVKTLERIARALKVKVEDLFHFPDCKENQRRKTLNELVYRLIKGKNIKDIELVSKIAETVAIYSAKKKRGL